MTKDMLIKKIREAEEFFSFNVIGAYAGKQTPVFLIR